MWKDTYLIGVAHIDEQHRELFRNVGELMDMLWQDISFMRFKLYVCDSLEYLKGYVAKHFADEEEYQRIIGYENLDEHKKQHQKLVIDLTKIEQELVARNFDKAVVKKFLGFLLTWLIYHVGNEDQKIPKHSSSQPFIINKTTTTGRVVQFAESAKQVIEILTGISEENINYKINDKINRIGVLYYKVDFKSEGTYRGVGFIFCESFAFNVLKAMTGLNSEENILSELNYSALQEISNIITARIAEIIALDGEDCDVDVPVRVNIDEDFDEKNAILLNTTLGNLEIAIY